MARVIDFLAEELKREEQAEAAKRQEKHQRMVKLLAVIRRHPPTT
jgi:hypothetical protein